MVIYAVAHRRGVELDCPSVFTSFVEARKCHDSFFEPFNEIEMPIADRGITTEEEWEKFADGRTLFVDSLAMINGEYEEVIVSRESI